MALSDGGVDEVRFAYADPPYFGCGKRLYGHLHPEAAVWDNIEAHKDLLARLVADYPAGWAYSLTSGFLLDIAPFVPRPARIGAWVKPFAVFKPGVNPAYAWEPILFNTTRKRSREEGTVRDWISAPITLRRGLAGAKPDAFCFWLFDLLGMTHEDELHDLFPGTGAVTQAFDSWRRQRRLA